MTPPNSAMTIREAAEAYLARGWMPIPVPHRSKNPGYTGWELTRLRPEDIPARFDGQPQNIGVLLGEPSRWLIDVDLDHARCVERADQFLPPTPAVFGRPGKPRSHRIYIVAGPVATRKFKSKSAGMLVELRSTGMQTIFPPSTHESGEPIAWETEGAEPAVVSPDELLAAVERLASAVRVELGEKAAPKPQKPSAKGRDGGHQAAAVGPRGNRAARVEHYVAQALRLELNAVYSATPGGRNDTLNKAAFNLGTLIGGGYLDRQHVEESLRQAALAAGLEAEEVDKTIRSGIGSGMQQPRQIPDQPGPIHTSGPEQDAAAGPEQIPTVPRGMFAFDLYGNADRFVHLFGRDVHWCEDRGKWYVWDGRVWKPDALREVNRLGELTIRALFEEGVGDEAGLAWATKCNRDAKPAREMIEVLKHRTAISINQLDCHPWLLGVDNGVVDLRTGKLLPHDRKYLITVLCPISFDPAAGCPRWLQFLDEIMAAKQAMIDALQRLAGYCLTGDISVQVLLIFFGTGANGKNVFLDTIMGIMGPHAAEAPEGLVTIRRNEEHPTEIADLYGKRLVVASETEEGKKMRMGLVKKMTGNKYLKGRFMRQDFFQFERTHKTILVTNNRPIVSETSNAVWRRLRLIPFAVTIPEEQQDKHLTDKLIAEWPGILAWMVRGCLDWQQRQCDLALPDEVHEATEAYRDDSDLVADFIVERCVDWRDHQDQKMRAPKDRVYTAYSNWCRDIGEDALDRTEFNNRMRGHGFVDKTGKMPGERKAQKCWFHLTLKAETDDAGEGF